MAITAEKVAAAEIVGGGTTALHSHTGGGGNGYIISSHVPTQTTTTDAQTVYWGSLGIAQSTTADIQRIYIPKAGTIKACYIYVYATTAGSAENWSMYIRKNNSADTLVQTLGLSSTKRVWSNTSLSITVVAGDYLEIKEVEPTWATNPASITRAVWIYIE